MSCHGFQQKYAEIICFVNILPYAMLRHTPTPLQSSDQQNPALVRQPKPENSIDIDGITMGVSEN